MVKYYYDAWGNHKIVDKNGNSVTSGVGILNPFRYRGYYFDTETGLYYLNSRYYDPKTCRFISPDSTDYLDPETIGGLNLYAYCNNNPIMNVDPDGHAWWHWLLAIAGVVGLAVATVVSAGGVAAGIAAITAASCGTTVAGASVLTTTLAFATVGGGATLASSGIVAGIYAVEESVITGSISNGLNKFFGYGETAMWNTLSGAAISSVIGYFSYANYGTHTPKRSNPFGTYYNTKSQTITHYSATGNMLWSKHLTDHGRPDLHYTVPHWHTELPHSKMYSTRKELFVELLKRFFRG